MTFVSRRWMGYWQDAALGGAAGALLGECGILLLSRAANDYWLPVLATVVPLALAGGIAVSLVAIYWRSTRVQAVGWSAVTLAWFGALAASVATLAAMPSWHTLVLHHRFVVPGGGGYIWTWQQTVRYFSTSWGSTLPIWWLAMALLAIGAVGCGVALAWSVGGSHTSTIKDVI